MCLITTACNKGEYTLYYDAASACRLHNKYIRFFLPTFGRHPFDQPEQSSMVREPVSPPRIYVFTKYSLRLQRNCIVTETARDTRAPERSQRTT